jgi:hypothetical protein
MHHYIFPSQDTYITNRPKLDTKNFGVDEIFQVGTDNSIIGYISDTTNYTYVNQYFQNYSAQDFTGIFTGSISPGTASFTGSLTGVTGCLTGTGSGVDVRQQRSRQYSTASYVDRALLKFDLTAISQSIATGSIVSASFHLKVKICNEYQLPIEYRIFVAPISESWGMGDGYASDGGSDDGASWVYRDYYGGTPWVMTGSTFIPQYVTQSFRYKSADLDVDVTPIVNQWLSGSVLNNGFPNNGFVVMSSDEFHPTGSGFLLKYFSEDTNTIYSPVLDVAWGNDWEFTTGSFFTASADITTASGSSVTVNSNDSGSWFNGIGGVHGNFTASTDFRFGSHYITSSGDMTYYCDHLVQQFTGSLTGSFYGVAQVSSDGTFSGSGEFYTDYFTGSIDGFVFETVNQYISGTYISGTISGEVIMPTASIEVFTGHLMSPAISLTGTGSGRYYDTASYSFDGLIMGRGISGNIAGVPIIGTAYGVINATTTVVTLPTEWHFSYPTSPNESPYGNMIRQIFNCGPYCGTTPCDQPGNPWNWNNYNMGPHGIHPYPACNNSPYAFDSLYYIWGGDDVGWRTTLPHASSSVITSSCGKFHTVQLMTGTFNGGNFSGSSFFAFYENYRISFGVLTGSWNPWVLGGEILIINFPAVYDNYYTAYLYGPYVFGPLVGMYTTSGSYSSSFDGQFVDGQFIGGVVNLQLFGNAFTSSFVYTSSVNMSSSVLAPLDIKRPFSINIGNLQPEYKAGDIIKVNVFGRMKFPLKYYGISPQQEQYLVPEFLPTSSYYALKDNQTDEIVMDFDSYTQISCAYPEGNYFLVDTTSLPQERYYRILIRVQDGSQIDTIDTGKTFKITR